MVAVCRSRIDQLIKERSVVDFFVSLTVVPGESNRTVPTDVCSAKDKNVNGFQLV
jgi:hypothetical protein